MSKLSYEPEQAARPPQLGLVVLQADETLERDLRALLPEHAELLVTRIASATTVSSAGLAAMAQEITAACALLPRGAEIACVGFGCTSGAAEIGSEDVAGLVRAGVGARHVTDPVLALVAACRHLGATRLACVSPYVAEVSARLQEVLNGHGITFTTFASFEEAEEARVVRISARSVRDAAEVVAQDGRCEAVFLSCTNLRTLPVIAEVEAATGRPVLSSNLVMAWHMAQLAGLAGCGGGLEGSSLWPRADARHGPSR